MGEAGVRDQSVDESAPQRRVHGQRLLGAGRHSDHRRDAAEVVKIHREHPVVHDAADRLAVAVVEPAAGVPDRILRQEGPLLSICQTQSLQDAASRF